MGLLLEKAKKLGITIDSTDTLETIVAKLEKGISDSGEAVLLNPNDKPLWLPKDRYDSVNTKYDVLKADYDKIIAEKDGLSTKVNQLVEIEKQKNELDVNFKNYKLESTSKFESQKLGFRDFNDIKGLLDLTKVTLKDDGTHEGLVEQLTAIKEAKPYLLDDTNSNLGGGGSNPPPNNNNKPDIKSNDINLVDLQKAVFGM